jgi:hypothetical protein
VGCKDGTLTEKCWCIHSAQIAGTAAHLVALLDQGMIFQSPYVLPMSCHAGKLPVVHSAAAAVPWHLIKVLECDVLPSLSHSKDLVWFALH